MPETEFKTRESMERFIHACRWFRETYEMDAPVQHLMLLTQAYLHPGCAQTQLGKDLLMSRASVSRMCRNLSIMEVIKDDKIVKTGLGLIECVQDDDRRSAVNVFLTPKGSEAITEFIRISGGL